MSENYRARVNLAAPICTIKGVRIGVAFTYSMSHIDFAADTPFNTTYGSASKLDHHVFSPTLNAGYIFRIGQLPIITNIGIRSDFSQYGYARTSGTVMAFAPLKKNDNSFLALGLFGMLNTTLITPCLPMVIYNYKFNDRFAFDLTFPHHTYLRYTFPNNITKLSCGTSVDFCNYYIKPDHPLFPGRYRYNNARIKPELCFEQAVNKNITMKLRGGMNVTVVNGIFKENGSKKIIKPRETPTAFLNLSFTGKF